MPTIAACYHEWQHLLTGAGRVGFGINVANLITGVFIATGQDVAAIESCHSNLSLSVLSSDEIESIGKCQLFPMPTVPIIRCNLTCASVHCFAP